MNASWTQTEYDLVIAGGGITGAGIFHRAVQFGYKTLLIEAKDFSWGTSSRSSKMVHGGLRYLQQGRLLMTRASVRQREYLIKRYPGLISDLPFLFPVFNDHGPQTGAMKIGLTLYSLMAGKKQHVRFTKARCIEKQPMIRQENLKAAFGFTDAQVDDARLVLRLIFDACRLGGTAKNYTRLDGIRKTDNGHVSGITLVDQETGEPHEIRTKALINATGIYADRTGFCPMPGYRLRPLRGSHLIFPGHLLKLDHVVSFVHPEDERPVFLFPWEGCLVLGTTDVDHVQNLDHEPRITRAEAKYLMTGLHFILPALKIGLKDCVSSIAGVRPVLSRRTSHRHRPGSRESREHVVWDKNGVITVTGGKLTTFRLLARDALKAAAPYLPFSRLSPPPRKSNDRCSAEYGFEAGQDPVMPCDEAIMQRLIDRYGIHAVKKFQSYTSDLFQPVAGTATNWAELCYSAKNEHVRHLDDLLLRRVRIGLLLPRGGQSLLERIQEVCAPFLPWDNHRWEQEKTMYMKIWEKTYSPPIF